MSHFIHIILILSICLTFDIGDSFADNLYKWTDMNGVLTYSPVPPSKELTNKYEKINIQDSIKSESSGKPQKEKTKEMRIANAIKPSSVNVNNVRRQRYCMDLNKQIATLEAKLMHVKDTKQLNKTMIFIGKYQQNIEKLCPLSR